MNESLSESFDGTRFPGHLEIIKLERCDSTNNYIKSSMDRWVDTGRLPVMVTSGLQTCGRGREQRHWESPPGMGLYTSFGFTWQLNQSPHLLPLAAGLSVIETVERISGIRPGLKWPNDVLVNGKKLAGILIENVIAESRLFCITGIGINVNQESADDFPPEIRIRAISIKMAARDGKGEDFQLEPVNRVLAHVFMGWLDKLKQGKTKEIIGITREASAFLINREITFHQPADNRLVRGIFKGINDDGALILETGNGSNTIYYSGEII